MQQHTPLLVSCLSPSTVTNNELFRVLLENKANVYHKNDQGETALDIAFKQKNNAVIEEIFKYAKKNNLSQASLMSPATQDKAREWVSVDALTSGSHFFISNFLSDTKQFVQQNVPEIADKTPEETADSSMSYISMRS